MRRKLKVVGLTLLVIALLGVGAISLTIGWRPFIGPKARPLTGRKFEATPERLARGRYLVDDLGCFDCHGEHDWTKHDAPLVEGTRGAGYPEYPSPGLPGHIVPTNITPDPETGAGSWTDDQLARAIREGIGHDGRALYPLMPYEFFRVLSDEDLASVIVYIRSIPPVHKALPKTEITFPVKYLIRSLPQPITQPVPPPDFSNPLERGKYLVTLAACSDCHTPQSKGQDIPGMEFAGGSILEGPWGKVASANITPDPSGISYYNEALFIQTLRTGYVRARKLNQIMGWWDYRHLSDDDLKAIFAYLRTLKPVKHRVDNAESPTLCKICGSLHGLGDKN
jgi:mono/diheme cytochrome c family protein